MSLKFAVLGLLSEKPRAGYEIAKKFGESVGFFWAASHQQIYQELAKLEGEKLVKFKEVAQDKNPSKKVYSLTKKGEAELLEWLAQETKEKPVKDELLIRIFCGHLIDPSLFIDEVKRLQKKHLEKFQTYSDIEKQHFSKPETLPRHLQFQYLTLQRGLTFEKGRLEWCKAALKTLEGGPS